MGSRRLVLVIGSQCAALGSLPFLPAGVGPIELTRLRGPQTLLVELRNLLVRGPGGCAPVDVEGQSSQGLLLNPTKAIADAAVVAAMTRAHEEQAVLVMHFLGHGRGYQPDPAAPARHLLHVWDTVAEPEDTERESNGWDPYELVTRRRGYCPEMVGLVLLVDACQASWAQKQVEAWGGVSGGLLSAWLGSSGDHTAWDACFSKTLVRVLKRGVSADEHPRRALVPDLLASDIEAVTATVCPYQAPRLGGYESHNPVLVVASNRAASQLAAELGVDGVTEALLLRLTEHYVTFAVTAVVDAVRSSRVVAVLGGPGTGKSTLAAALRHPTTDDVPVAVVQAVVFAGSASSVPELAGTLRRQLDRLPDFPDAVRRYQAANAQRWDTLDSWQQQITGPLTHYLQPVRLLVDGVDHLDGSPAQHTVGRALTALINDPALGHVSLLLTSRTPLPLEGLDDTVALPALDADTARRYLSTRHLDGGAQQLVTLAAGSWLVLALAADQLAADQGARVGDHVPETLDQLYTDRLHRFRARQGEEVADVVLTVLAVAGPGPLLPFDVFAEAVGTLHEPLSRAALHTMLGDPDLYPLLDRSRPGQPQEHLGVFHQTLVDHILAGSDPAEAHRAVADAVDHLAPAQRHDLGTYRSDPLLAYAFDAGPRHRWAADQPEQLVSDLVARDDPIPRVSLARWTTWAPLITERLGADHPDTLRTRSNTARWTGQAGDPKKALLLSRQLLPDRQRVLGDDHPDTLRTRREIAGWTGDAGDPKKALRLFQELLPDEQRVLGDDHPDTLTTRRDIARWIGEAGDPKKALRLFRKLLPDRRRVRRVSV